MKTNITELIFILDRSGSMTGLETDTIGGFNSMMEKQRKEEGEVIVTTVLFDHQYELLHDEVPIDKVQKMTSEEYYTRGSTALLDAMGSTIQRIIHVQDRLPSKARADKVIFVIITDGMENSSCEYTYKDVKRLVEQQKEKGWEFLFLGANIDAEMEAGRFGIRRDRAVRYHSDRVGTQMNYNSVSEVVSCMRMADCLDEVDGSWKEDIEDYRRKKEGK